MAGFPGLLPSRANPYDWGSCEDKRSQQSPGRLFDVDRLGRGSRLRLDQSKLAGLGIFFRRSFMLHLPLYDAARGDPDPVVGDVALDARGCLHRKVAGFDRAFDDARGADPGCVDAPLDQAARLYAG